jgi:iron complex outermembrane receptor protein/outer membrane receptor for ferric coprogen and ferric-rhodotorulic acid
MMADGSLWDRQLSTKPTGIEQMQINVFNFNPYALPYAAPRYDQDGGRSYLKTEQTGLYLTTRWNLADSLKLITGVRESNFKYDSNIKVMSLVSLSTVVPLIIRKIIFGHLMSA